MNINLENQCKEKNKSSARADRVLLNEYQASERLGLAVATLRKNRWAGNPPRFLKVGRKILYDAQDIADYLNSCFRNSTSDRGIGHEN